MELQEHRLYEQYHFYRIPLYIYWVFSLKNIEIKYEIKIDTQIRKLFKL